MFDSIACAALFRAAKRSFAPNHPLILNRLILASGICLLLAGSSTLSAEAVYWEESWRTGGPAIRTVPENEPLRPVVSGDTLAASGIPLGEALDAPHLEWATGGTSPWVGQTDETFDEVDAAQSGPITHDQESWVETTVTGPGALSFWWKVSSEPGFDWLLFSIDGAPLHGISGEVDWVQRTVVVGAGPKVLRWTYFKDDIISRGEDSGWLDQVAFHPDPDLEVYPRGGFSSLGYEGGPFTPGAATYILSNITEDPLDWTAGASVGWISISPSGGTLSPGETTEVMVGFETEAEALPVGTHDGTVLFENLTAGVETARRVTLTVHQLTQAPPDPFDPMPRNLTVDLPLDTALSWNQGAIFNGGFETGDMSRWGMSESPVLADGGWFSNDGTFKPHSPDGPLPPYSGAYSAIADQKGPGEHILYQDLKLSADRPVRLEWAHRIRNHTWRGFWVTQGFRVEVVATVGHNEEWGPFEIGDVLFETQEEDPLLQDWTTHSVELGDYSWAHESGWIDDETTFRISFVQNATEYHLEAHLDDIRLVLPGAEADQFAVFFGTDPSALDQVAEGLISPQFDPGPLAPEADYYWQVVASNPLGTVAGPVWTFRTVGIGTVEVEDSIAPVQDYAVPFGTVSLGGERRETILIRNSHPEHDLRLENIRLQFPGQSGADALSAEPVLETSSEGWLNSSGTSGDTHPRGPQATAAVDWTREHHPTTLIVGYKDSVSMMGSASIHATTGGRVARTMRRVPLQVVELPAKGDLRAALEAYARHPAVAYVEPNYVFSTAGVPDDPRYGELWGLHNTGQTGGTPGADISALEAWEWTRGSDEIIVAVIDSGIDYTHPDLAANMWVNPNPTFGDIHGARWTGGDGVVTSGNPMDDNGHGTHVAGTIGAVGNNGTGITGVAWSVRLMALKFLSSGGRGYAADAIAAIEYAIDHGAHVSNNSWGGPDFSRGLYGMIEAAGEANQLFVTAAGNDYADNDKGKDRWGPYPATYDLDNIISVASSNHHDARSPFSNWGVTTVHLAAPGSRILSTLPNNRYETYSGTSMAAPHVAGVAALVLALTPDAPYSVIKRHILDGVTPSPRWEKLVISGGRLNAAGTLSRVASGFLVEGAPSLPITLAPGASHLLEVIYQPALTGDHEAWVIVETNDFVNPILSVAMSGTAVRPVVTFDDWVASMDLPSGSRGVQDRNGPLQLTNLQAYAMGLDPLTATTTDLPRIKKGGEGADHLFLVHQVHTGAVNAMVNFEVSEDLREWLPLTPVLERVRAIKDGIEFREMTVDIADWSTLFFRVNIGYQEAVSP